MAQISFRVELMQTPDSLRNVPMSDIQRAFAEFTNGMSGLELDKLPIVATREIAYDEKGAHFFELAEMLGNECQIHARIQLLINGTVRDAGIIHYAVDPSEFAEGELTTSIQVFIAQVVLNKVIDEYNSMGERMDRAIQFMWTLAWGATLDIVKKNTRWLH